MQAILRNSLVLIGSLLSLSCSSLMLPSKDFSKIPNIGAFIEKNVDKSTGENVYKYLTSNTFDQNNQYFSEYVQESMRGVSIPATLLTSTEQTFKNNNPNLNESFKIEGLGHYRTPNNRKSINIFQFSLDSERSSKVFSVYESK